MERQTTTKAQPSAKSTEPNPWLHRTVRPHVTQRTASTLQPKLAISQPGDVYEQEADRVADQVLRMPDPTVQRACGPCSAGGGTCPKCAGEKQEPLPPLFPPVYGGMKGGRVQGVKGIQRQSKSATTDHSVSDNFISGLGSGRPLDSATRAFFEPRFGTDFSHVRVHTDSHAAASARSVNALAYTVGHDVVFGAGQYAPQTSEGRHLLAHELTHVVQQRRAIIEPRIQRWSYGSGTHSTGGGNTFGEVTAAERGGGNGVDASMRIINSLVTGTNGRARHCQKWFTDNATVARSLADVHSRAVIWMWRAAPSTIAGLTDGGNTAHHANAEWLFKQRSRWSLAGNMMHEYWHDCSSSADPDIGDKASAACGLPVV